LKAKFDDWLGVSKDVGTSNSNGGNESGPSAPPVTRAFSVEEIMERTGLSKTKLYEEIAQKNLRAKKAACELSSLRAISTNFSDGYPGV
jgi:hypothetical protein